MKKLIEKDRSIILACDTTSLKLYRKLIKETSNIQGVGAYKIGFELGLMYGLPNIVDIAKKYTQKPIIYDHQKAGTDVPFTGKRFAKVCKDAGVDSIILLPQAGPKTQEAWINSTLDQGLDVIVGGLMSHEKYVRSEGGYLNDEAIEEMYVNAAKLGVNSFVVPGTKPKEIEKIKKILDSENANPIFYCPGFEKQGGSIADAAKVAGDNWHAIIGRAIYEKRWVKHAAKKFVKQLP